MKKLFLMMLTLVVSITTWAADPYFEVIDGSFASGNVTLKITFPEATSIVLEGEYGAGLYMEHTGTYVSAAYDFTGTLTTDGINTITAVYSGFTPLEDDAKYYVYSFNMKVDGAAYSDKIYSLDSRPYAEVMEGSIGSGNVTVRVSAPQVASLGFYGTSYPQFYYAALRHNGAEIAKLTIDSPQLTISGNTISAVFSYAAIGDEVLANYDVYFNQYCLQFNGQWNNNDVTVPFKSNTPDPSGCAHEPLTHYDLVESTDQVQGHDAYDKCDDCGACFATDDTEHENALTPSDFILPLDTDPIDYFYVQNLEPIRTMIGVPRADLEYRLEGGDGVWRTVTTEAESTLDNPAYKVLVPAYGKVYLRATKGGNTSLPGIFEGGTRNEFPVFEWEGEPYHSAITNITYTDARVNYAIGGDITTLLRSNGKVKTLPEPTVEIDGEGNEVQHGIFECIFQDYSTWNGRLLSAAELKLPSTTLSERCYYEMFSQCENLTEGPAEISAITMAPYSCYHMFNWCNKLTAAPVIKAKTMAEHSCDGMFYMEYGNDAQLATVPDLEVETVGEYGCHEMFANCVNLTEAPEIPATTVAPHCFEGMFSECLNLAVAPTILPATTLAEDCYNMMFYNCTALQRAPELPAPSLVEGCYVQMFNGCHNLNYMKVGLMTDWPVRITYDENLGYSVCDYYCTRDWVAGVNGDGTFCGPTCLFKEYYYGAGLYDVVPYYYNGYSYTRWASENPMTVPVTITSAGYATFCYDYNWIIPEGTEGYMGYVDEEGNLHLEKGFDAGDIVNSYRSCYETYEDGKLINQWVCKAVVLKGAPGTYDVTLTDEQEIGGLEEAVSKNQLYGSMHDFDISLFHTLSDDVQGIHNNDYYYYSLSQSRFGNKLGFYWMKDEGAPFVTKPYKAFLRGLKSVIDAKGFKDGFTFEDAIADAIEKITITENNAQQHSNAIYDLSGRRVGNNAQKGLYIINGKKVVK